MSSRHSRKKRDLQQFIFDDYTKCHGLTQEQQENDLKLLSLPCYTAPAAKYKISNPIMNKSKREIITSIYDKKNISNDLVKTNEQLISELKSLKNQINKIENDIIHNQTQIHISKLQKEIVTKQFEFIQKHKNKQIELLNEYNNKCKSSIAKTENELSKLITENKQNTIHEQSLMNALYTIENLKNQLKNKKEIVNIIQKKELLQNTNDDILKLNEKFDNIEKKQQEQRKTNTILRAENKRIVRELEETKTSYDSLFKTYDELNNELISLKYVRNNELLSYANECNSYKQRINLLNNECHKYNEINKIYIANENENELLNAYVSLNYYNELLVSDGLKKANLLLQNQYNELEKQNLKIMQCETAKKDGRLAKYELENIIIEEKKKNNGLTNELYLEKQKYFQRIISFKDSLDLLYLKTEKTVRENNLMKQETRKKTFELQRENDKLRQTVKRSNSNLRVKETENESVNKQKQIEHLETVKIINGNKMDLEKRVDILKKAIKDLNGALSDCHIQMLSFQKQVYDEMNCSVPKDDNLIIHKKNTNRENNNNNNNINININCGKKKKKNRKRNRSSCEEHENNNNNTNTNQSPNTKRRRISATNNNNNNNNKHAINNDIIESDSSSSEISHGHGHGHGSHLIDDELYSFQGALAMEENQNSERIFYSILSNTKSKTDNYILLNDYIKITRRGHPDYTGRVESMFYEKTKKKKKVCVTIFQLASDIPNLKECMIINDNNESDTQSTLTFNEGKREYVQLILSKKIYKQFKNQKENTKIFGVGRIHTNKKVTLWFPKKNIKFKSIEKKTSGRDVYFCRYKYDKHNKTLIRIDGTDDKPINDYQ